MSGAAFFDLDRTLISRSSSLALAPAFHRRGLLRRRRLGRRPCSRSSSSCATARGRRGSGGRPTSAMAFLKGLPVETMREIVAEALDSAFLPHVYRDALDLIARHRERGERAYIVSAALQEVVDAIVARARARRGRRLDRRDRGRRLHGSSRPSAGRPREGRSGRRARRRGEHRPRRVDGLLRLRE